ncbi:MAG: D-aminoacylase [Deltaproteobacteria bacterium]|nr:D-aminoacylase [Deltaproteobacteria bacterium]
MYDVLIQNGRIIDGTGSPWFYGDVAVSCDTIRSVGHLTGADAALYIDARGRCVCPGFIDPHTHTDYCLFDDPAPDYKLRQGITTEVMGNCGMSLAPLDDATRVDLEKYVSFMATTEQWEWRGFDQYMDAVERRARPRTNVMALAGHGTLRIAAMGFRPGEPSRQEMDKMKSLLTQAMEAGALGMSSGLIYPPGSFSRTPELVDLARVLIPYGGVYFSHIRGESDTLMEALEEAIEIGRQAGVPVHIAHHKAMGSHMWGSTKETLQRIDRARDEGIDVTADVYPYVAGSGPLHAMLPPWAAEGGVPAALERVRDAAQRQRIQKEMLEGVPGWAGSLKGIGWNRIMIATSRDPAIQGRTVEEIAAERDADAFQCAFDLLLADEGTTRIIKFAGDEEDLQRVLCHPAVMVGSDSSIVAGHPHPRNYGTFPRVLARFVREKKSIRLEQAVQKMTSMPAARCRLLDRGILRPGMKADVVVFDPMTVEDRATFTEPHQHSTGISWILVNGQVAVENGQTTQQTAGRLLRYRRNAGRPQATQGQKPQ